MTFSMPGSERAFRYIPEASVNKWSLLSQFLLNWIQTHKSMESLYSLYRASLRDVSKDSEPQPLPSRVSAIKRDDWNNFSGVERLEVFSKSQGILLLDNPYNPPEFSKVALVSVCPSLTKRIRVQSM
jgi:hypothetical protein